MNKKISLGDLRVDKFNEEGLYLIFPNDDCICVTQNYINNYFKKIWQDSSVFPSHIKKATDLQLCEHCPGKKSEVEFCVALRPILPFLEKVDKYVSYDDVTAVLKTNNPSVITVRHTDLQNALRYVSLLSLIKYCETNRRYWSYYFGVSPLADVQQALAQIYLNIFWLNKGDKKKTHNAINIFTKEMRISNECLLRRLKLICKNDAFINAYANTQMSSEFLSMNGDDILDSAFETHINQLTKLKDQ
ncbi:MAG: hypothetical protein GXO85_09325 [Chlorobi bacterium]|nr:hypothetical protein [Chlorobiota bacterium]